MKMEVICPKCGSILDLMYFDCFYDQGFKELFYECTDPDCNCKASQRIWIDGESEFYFYEEEGKVVRYYK